LSINKENLLTVSSHEDEVSTLYMYEDTNLTDIQEDDDIFSAINYASKEVNQISNNLYDDNEELIPANIFQNSQRYLKNVDQFLDPDLLSILNNVIVNLGYQYLLESALNFKSLFDQCQLHNAYCSKPLERKFKSKASSSTRVGIMNSISSNKASHLVAYFTKNENPEQQFVKQKEKRWKENRKNMSLTLAQLHSEEIKTSKKENHPTEKTSKPN
ncbi:20566_t:CDS:2, partial [Gigaspora margarita]